MIKVNFIDSKHTKLLEYGETHFVHYLKKIFFLAAIAPLKHYGRK